MGRGGESQSSEGGMFGREHRPADLIKSGLLIGPVTLWCGR